MDCNKKEISRAIRQVCLAKCGHRRPQKGTLRIKPKVKNKPVLQSPGDSFFGRGGSRTWHIEAAVAGI